MEERLGNATNSTYHSFEDIFLRILDFHAVINLEILGINENSFIAKGLLKSSVVRSKAKNLCLNNKTESRGDHLFSMYAKFSEKLTFLNP